MRFADAIGIAGGRYQMLQITAPAIQGTAALGHFITPFKELVDLLPRQPFTPVDTIEIMEYDLEDFDLWVSLQKLL
jgi:hypothetical protein